MARRPTARNLTIAAALAGTAAGLVAERRHLRRLASDADYRALAAPLGGRSRSVVSPDGTRLHVEAFGPEEADTVVLTHGWTEVLSLWGPVIGRLSAAGLRCVAYDLRGHGASAAAAEHDYSLERFGEDLEAVLAAVLSPGARAIVAGHSLGAMSIAAWAQHHDVPARARAAALINTGLGDLLAGHLLFGELTARLSHPAVSRLVLGSRAPLPAVSSPLSAAVIRHAAFGPEASAGQVAFYERMLLATSPDARGAVGLAMSRMDLWDAVARLTVPTLVVAGERDRLTPPAHAERIARTLPACVGLTVLAGTGHMGPLERPQEIADLLLELASAGVPVGGGAAS